MNDPIVSIQSEFGANAEAYAVSEVHARGESLKRLVERTNPQPEWSVLDIATGAGHTAFVFAPHVREVFATDLTREMIELSARGAGERGLENVTAEFAQAEELPYPDNRFDLVTCRIAAHHFPDRDAFLRESLRVLKPGGTLALVDNIVPDGPPGAYVNAFEKLRDPSHGRCLGMAEWQAAYQAAGYERIEAESMRKVLRFEFWAKRHGEDVRSYLQSMLELAAGAAREHLAPAEVDGELVFHLTEALITGRKPRP